MECKEESEKRLPLKRKVLMEPKWNVKEYVKAMICYTLRINGTKVECKGKKIKVTFAAGEGINGTKVECKERELCYQFESLRCSINGTKVECKEI